MAIDTRDKRASVAGVFPIPDGVIDILDRRQAAGMYRRATVADAMIFIKNIGATATFRNPNARPVAKTTPGTLEAAIASRKTGKVSIHYDEVSP